MYFVVNRPFKNNIWNITKVFSFCFFSHYPPFFSHALSPSSPPSLIHTQSLPASLTLFHYLHLVSVFPDQHFSSSLSAPTLFSSPHPLPPLPPFRRNPAKRCISYYQSLMNLDLKMEYCPETNLSYEGGKKNSGGGNLVRSWVPEQTGICSSFAYSWFTNIQEKIMQMQFLFRHMSAESLTCVAHLHASAGVLYSLKYGGKECVKFI